MVYATEDAQEGPAQTANASALQQAHEPAVHAAESADDTMMKTIAEVALKSVILEPNVIALPLVPAVLAI